MKTRSKYRVIRSPATLLTLAALLAAALSAGCASPLPTKAPPLRDMEAPLALFDEPDDETARRALDAGGFTGLTVSDAGDTLESLVGEAAGLQVDAVVENSPGDAAGLETGDLLLEAAVDGDAPVTLSWASQWRQLELTTPAGTVVDVVYDRAGVRFAAAIEIVRRLRAAERAPVSRYREDDRVGVVVRTGTEVEARAAGLGPGGGAVVVGLSRASPWRAAGLQYGDLLVALGDRTVDDPRVVLEVVRAADARDTLAITYVRDGDTFTVDAPLTRRATETTGVNIPLLYTFERDRDRTKTSIFFWIYQEERTPAAWKVTLLWFLSFSGGESDRLREVSP